MNDVNAQTENSMEAPTQGVKLVANENTRFQEFVAWHRQIKNVDVHFALQDALLDHV